MAKSKLNLQAYQQDILARLKDLTENTTAVTASKLGVSINGFNWLIALEDVSEVVPLPEITRVPQTQPWFMGMANVRGNLYALTDLANFLGYPATTISANSRILLVHQKFDMNAGLLVERLVGLRSSDDMEKQDDIGEQAAWYVNQYKDANNETWHELDLGRLLNQHEFMQVAA
jgi:twitching motility protein PilI